MDIRASEPQAGGRTLDCGWRASQLLVLNAGSVRRASMAAALAVDHDLIAGIGEPFFDRAISRRPANALGARGHGRAEFSRTALDQAWSTRRPPPIALTESQ